MWNVSLQQVIGTRSMQQGRVVDWRSILCYRGTNMPWLHGLTFKHSQKSNTSIGSTFVMNEEKKFNKTGII